MDLEFIFNNFIAVEKNLGIDNKQLEKYCLELKEKNNGRKVSNYGGWQSNDLRFDDKDMKPLLDVVVEKMNSLKEYLGFKQDKKISIENYWVNINQKGDFNKLHKHPFSLFSASYYVKVPKDSGQIHFMNPINEHNYTIRQETINEFNYFNSNEWHVQPEEGTLIVFPSWLNHLVLPNEGEEERISIAFNTQLV
jgi:uncharacterized protein (TIGR02466 family)